MALDQDHPFARNDVWPSWFPNSLQRALSILAFGLQLTKQDATHVQVTATAAVGAAVVGIQGRWRWLEGTINRAHPGGAAGTYAIFAVAADNKIDSVPAPGTDNTNYAFELRVLKAGETPTIVKGTLDLFREIGTCQWNGTEITRVDQIVPVTPTHAHRHATGQPDAIAPGDIGAASEVEAEALRAAAGDAGILQAGVVSPTDWSFTAAINGATGALSSTGVTGGVAWIAEGGALIRTVTPAAIFSGVAPASLPAPGKFMSIGIEVHPVSLAFGIAAVVRASLSGAEKATEGEALAAPGGPNLPSIRVCDVIVKNTGGVYSIVAQRDRRRWASGGFAAAQIASEGLPKSVLTSVLTPKGQALRLEVGPGGVVRITGLVKVKFAEPSSAENNAVRLQVLMDGGAVFGQLIQSAFTAGHTDSFVGPAGLVLSGLTPGSHLFDLVLLWESGTAAVEFDAGSAGKGFVVEELLGVSTLRMNGTA